MKCVELQHCVIGSKDTKKESKLVQTTPPPTQDNHWQDGIVHPKGIQGKEHPTNLEDKFNCKSLLPLGGPLGEYSDPLDILPREEEQGQ